MAWIFDPLPPLAFDLIMIDPAWEFGLWSDRGAGKSPQAHYECMPLDQIKALPVGHLARGDAYLWLWATHPMLPQALEAMNAWGFRYVTSGVWVKRTRHGKLGFGTGYVLRSASEPFLIGAVGSPKPAKNVRTVVEGPLRENSRKPDEAYAAAEALLPGEHVRRADIFSREHRHRWDAWGNEVGKFDGVAT